MSNTRRLTVFAIAISLVAGGCYGPFNFTRRLHAWNDRVGGSSRWQEEFIFLLLTWAPVYGLAVTADALLFNSLEFWTGTNPVQPPVHAWQRLDRGGETISLAATPEGGVVVRDADGQAVAYYLPDQVQRAMELTRR